jgi:glycosyltransferase involved in cell wall biosynthesis
MPPEISIIIPTYNREKSLVQSLESVLRQEFSNWECLVVDDGSLDSTFNLVNWYVQKDPRFKFFQRPATRQKGANACRNIGMENASGAFVTFLDSDDEYLPVHLEKRLRHMKEACADLTFGASFIFDGLTKRVSQLRSKKQEESWYDFALQNNITTPTLFIKRDLVKSTSFDEQLLRHQDWDFLMRLPKDIVTSYYPEPTFVIHWKKYEKRNIHFESCVRTYTKYKSQISSNNFLKRYLFNLYEKAVNYDADEVVVSFYRKELLALFDDYSLSEKFKLHFPKVYRYLRTIYVGTLGFRSQ